jgi:hypothetical protein
MESENAAISDVELTRSLYRQYEPHRCTCAFCRNVQAQWTTLLTAELRSILLSLGIDLEKPDEIIDFGRVGNGRLCHILWSFVAIAKDTSNFPDLPPINADLQIRLFRDNGKPETPINATGHGCILGVECKNVPWVIPDKEPVEV